MNKGCILKIGSKEIKLSSTQFETVHVALGLSDKEPYNDEYLSSSVLPNLTTMTVDDAAAILKLSRERVIQFIRDGRFEASKKGVVWAVSRLSVDRLTEDREANPPHEGRPE